MVPFDFSGFDSPLEAVAVPPTSRFDLLGPLVLGLGLSIIQGNKRMQDDVESRSQQKTLNFEFSPGQ